MRKFTKRLKKKYYSSVLMGIFHGSINPFHAKRAMESIQYHFDHQYLTVFRPWWYENNDLCEDKDLITAYKKFFDKASNDLFEKTGIDLKILSAYLKTLPKRNRVNRKPRVAKEQPIRKYKNPQGYKISIWSGRKVYWHNIIGEPAFQHRGYDFFISYYRGSWVVSDVAAGAAISRHNRYKMALKIAREKIEQNFEEYVSRVNKRREEENEKDAP